MKYYKQLVEYHQHGYGFRHPTLPIQYITCNKCASTWLSEIFELVLKWPIHNYILEKTFDWYTVICVREPWDWYKANISEQFVEHKLKWSKHYKPFLSLFEPINHRLGNHQSAYYLGLTKIKKLRFSDTLTRQVQEWCLMQHDIHGDKFVSTTPDIAGEWIDIIRNSIRDTPKRNVAKDGEYKSKMRTKLVKPKHFEKYFKDDYRLWQP